MEKGTRARVGGAESAIICETVREIHGSTQEIQSAFEARFQR